MSLSLEELTELFKAARIRYEAWGQPEDLEEMVDHSSAALTFFPPGHAHRGFALENHACALSDRFSRLGSIKDLEDAIAHNQEALPLYPLDHPNRSGFLLHFGAALHKRYHHLGNTVDLEGAIAHYRESHSLCPPDDLNPCMSLYSVAGALCERYKILGSNADLEEALAHNRECLRLCPPGHPLRFVCLGGVANILQDRCKQSRNIQDLEDAITYHREALSLRPPSLGGDRSILLNNLGYALHDLYRQKGTVDDLENAITYHRESLRLRPPGHQYRYSSFTNIGIALHDRYRQSGRTVDLEDAIAFHRRALKLCPPKHSRRSNCLNELANALHDKYDQMGRLVDLQDAVTCHREALGLRPPGHPSRSSSLTNLAIALQDVYMQLGTVVDLEDAIIYQSESLSLCPPGNSRRFNPLHNLAIAHHDRYKQTSNIADLELSITYHLEAFSLSPLDHQDRSMSLDNVAIVLRDRYKRLGRFMDLEEAIMHHYEALSSCPPGHPNRSLILSNLVESLLLRYDQTCSTSELEDIFELIRQAVDDAADSLKHRLFVAQCWASEARKHHHKSLLDAYSTIFRLLSHSLILQPDVHSRHKFLASIDLSIASDAASAAIDAHDLPKAIELLEQGRAILWSKMTTCREPLEELDDKELASRFANLSAGLEHLAVSQKSQRLESDRFVVEATSEARLRKMRDLPEKWNKAVKSIRTKEGFSNFLQAVPFESLREAAADGPVIVINVSKYRCDAIILLINSPPLLVPLPGIQPEDLSGLARQLVAACKPDVRDPSNLLVPILRDLWDYIVYPVVDRLEKSGVAEGSRIWWCPTSQLCGLPLHAAGPYRKDERNLPDRYISSYITTISALIRARSNTTRQSTAPELLVIGEADNVLGNVELEIRGIQQIGIPMKVITGAEASRHNVLNDLQQHAWVHFACHGVLGDDGGPFKTGFKLQGAELLSLRDLIHARMPKAELAFLSAFHSAAADPTTPNETISLTAALQFCGFRSVVGTMWAMVDYDGPPLSAEFYRYMLRDPENGPAFTADSAKALHVAIQALKEKKVPLARRIMFIHIGA